MPALSRERWSPPAVPTAASGAGLPLLGAVAGNGRSAFESPLPLSAASAASSPISLLLHLPLPACGVTRWRCLVKCGHRSVHIAVRRGRRNEGGDVMRLCGAGDWRGAAAAADGQLFCFLCWKGVSVF